jgi:hypothetical protein
MQVAAIACAATGLALGSGCFWANKSSDTMGGVEARSVLHDDGRLQGAEAHVMAGAAGLYGDLEANLRDTERAGDPDRHKAFGLGFSVRVSPFGALGTDHVFDRYLDFGAEVGAGTGAVFGVAPEYGAAMSSAWYGAWLDIGTVPVHGGYLALTGGVRREVFAAPWSDRTQLTIGLAWRKRAPVSDEQLWWRH